jgi:hypothetical protein
MTTGCTFRFDFIDEVDALMAYIGEHGAVTIQTVPGGFLVSFASTDGTSYGTSREASVVEALRVIHEELEARNQ